MRPRMSACTGMTIRQRAARRESKGPGLPGLAPDPGAGRPDAPVDSGFYLVLDCQQVDVATPSPEPGDRQRRRRVQGTRRGRARRGGRAGAGRTRAQRSRVSRASPPPSAEHRGLAGWITRHTGAASPDSWREMVEEYTVRLLNALEPTVSRVPPPMYVGTLLGIVNTCLFYLRFGRGLRLFLPYLALGSGAAVVGVTAGTQLPESGLMLGDVNVMPTIVSTWLVLFVARSLRL